ncbi:C40 family peptidase [Nocardia mexicana]|nr:NlpC/P60 family protein [Nocardia mexicana]
MSLAPAALSAGAMAAGMLPMIASALAGLGGGGAGNGGGTGTGAGASGDSGEGGDGETSGLTPQAQKAIKVLEKLKKVYGDKDTDDPEVKKLRDELGVDRTGKGATATQVKAHRMYQRTAAKAFNTLDNDLVRYMQRLAGNHKLDKKAVVKLLRDTNAELADLGSAAYTKKGQLKVHQILTSALAKAHKIVSGTHADSKAAAREINRLTKQYIYNLAGQKYTSSAAAAGATDNSSPAVQRAVSVALAQQGDPYVWGAVGPHSFDCSGLTSYAARSAGVSIPRTSQEQYRRLPQVHPQNIKPGDLIFPASAFKNGGGPGHVMMYVGNGQCVEAPRPGASVRVVNLPSDYRATRWS